MEKIVKVTSINHEELVDIFSTATYGSDWLGFTTSTEYGAILPTNLDEIKAEFESKGNTYCREDKWADILLNGGTLVAIDYYDEDENSEEGKEYPITLETFLNGLNKAYSECPNNIHEVEKFDGSADYFDANNVMQVILFGELIYG